MQLKQQLKTAQLDVESVLTNYFKQPLNTADSVKQASEYGVLNGGKRLRPFLVYATGKMLGAEKADLDIVAAAIECVHSYSLVHDDLPAMDDDDLRRGRPTCHIVYGEAQAILAGDALQTLAFDLIAHHQFKVHSANQVKMIAALSRAAGLEGMVGGQALDIDATNKAVSLEQLQRIHQLKTGALLNCAITLGALCSEQCNDELLTQLTKFGHAIGLAFQVQDDILDVESNTELLGKPQGSDLAANKATYPALLGLDGAKQKAQALLEQAHEALAAINKDTSELKAMANYIVERNY